MIKDPRGAGCRGVSGPLEALEILNRSDHDQLWYVAHAVRPTDAEVAAVRDAERAAARSDVGVITSTEKEIRQMLTRANIASGKLWLARLSNQYPGVTFIAPWIAALDGGGGDDAVPRLRARGLRDCRRTVTRCDGIVLVGNRVSDGMMEEATMARLIIDLTVLKGHPQCILRDLFAPPQPVAVVRAADRGVLVEEQPPPKPRPDFVSVWETVIADVEGEVEGEGDWSDVGFRGWACIDDFYGDDDLKVVVGLVVDDMRRRDQIGRQRYGTPLTVDNGRDHLVDMYQELLDASVYTKAEILKRAPSSLREALMVVYWRLLRDLVLTRSMLRSGGES